MPPPVPSAALKRIGRRAIQATETRLRIRAPRTAGGPRTAGAWRLAREPAAVFVLIAVLSVAWLMFEGRHITFIGDEWDWLLHRRGTTLDVFLTPHNEHLSALPILVYKLFFQIFGASSTVPFRLLDAVLVAISAGLLFVLVRRRLGGWVGLAAAGVLMLLGPGWNDLLWGFQIGYMASLAAGLGAFLALERRDRNGDVLACVLLIVSISSSSVGLTVLVGVLVELLVLALGLAPRHELHGPASRRVGWQRLWVAGIPLLLYVLWYAGYGVSSVRLSLLPTIPSYDFHGLAAVAGSLTGLTRPLQSGYDASTDVGTAIAVLLLVGLAVRFVRGAPLSARFWAAATTAVAFWTAAGLSYVAGRDANSSHYTLPVAPFVILALIEAFLPVRVSGRALIVLAVASLAAVVSNLGFLHTGAKLFSLTSQYNKAELGALEVARGTVLPTFRPYEPGAAGNVKLSNLVPIDAGSYFAAIDSFGSAADDVAEIRRRPEAVREAADFVLVKAERLALAPAGTTGGNCTRTTPANGVIEISSGPGTVVLQPQHAPATNVLLRRFADAYSLAALGPLAAGHQASVFFPRDKSSLRWHIRILSSASVRVCAAA